MDSNEVVVATKFLGMCDEGCCVEIAISRPDKEKLTVEDFVAATQASRQAFMDKFKPGDEMETILKQYTKTDAPEHLN